MKIKWNFVRSSKNITRSSEILLDSIEIWPDLAEILLEMANSSLDLANLAKKGASNQLVWVFQVLGEEICNWPTGIGLCRKRPTANCQSSQVGVAINSDLVGFFRWVRSVGELDNPSPNYWIIKNNKNKRKCLEFF